MDAQMLKDRKVVLAGGVAIAMLAGLGIAIALGGHHRDGGPLSASSEPGELHVEMSKESDASLDPGKPLRCFVNGRFVGMETLNSCAKKNGVATGALDVGLDQTGEVAAATSSSPVLQPLPPPPAAVAEIQAPVMPKPVETPATPAAASGPVAACWRFNGVDWRRLPDQMSLSDCVQALYAGRCERPGDADYGRWDGDTLRRVTGRIERSGDNRNFHLLVPQRPGDCSIGRID
jgi:hypothetical protein